MRNIFIVLILFIASCRQPEQCWNKNALELEWYRLIDWRENMVYLSEESNDSLSRLHYRQMSDSLLSRITEVKYLMNNLPE